ILNTGVGGWDPNQYRIELKRILGIRAVDGILVFIYLGNDVIEKRVENYPPRQPVERHRFKFPTRFDWGSLVESIAYPINDFLEVRSHLFILTKSRLRYGLMRLGLTAEYFPESL